MHLDTTYVNRANTNAYVYQPANEKCRTDKHEKSTIIPMRDYHTNRKLLLFAQLVVANENKSDPRAAITFSSNNLMPHNYGKKRLRRPRLNWIQETTELFWKQCIKSQRND